MEANWSNGEQCWKVAATSRRPHVVTFQRRDVGSTDTEVNNQKRRDVSTLQRCDVSTGSAPHHLKHQWFRMGGIVRRTNEGTEFQSSSDTDFEEVTVICTVSHFLDIRMIFWRLNIFIFSFSMF